MVQINQYEPVYSEDEAKAAYDYLHSGGWCGDFKYTRQLEQMIHEYTKAKYVVIVNSGTTALQIAIMATGISGIALVPDYTMPATAYAASLCNMQVRLVDIDEKTLCMDNIKAIDKINTHSASIIMPVNINGRATYDMSNIMHWRSLGAFVIEDSCQAMGSWNLGSHLGTFGNIGVLSLNMFKLISTGQGGVLLTDDERLYTRIKQIKDFGRLGGRGAEYEMLGMNAKFNDLLAVIGIEQFKKIEQKIAAKKRLWIWYYNQLHDIEQVRFIATDLNNCTPWYIDLLVENRDALITYLLSNDIETQPFYQPIHRLKYYQGLGFKDKHFPNACYAADNGIWLPSSMNLTEETVDMVCDKIRSFYK